MNEKDINLEINRLKEILLEESKKRHEDASCDEPKNHYDEVFENCYLGDKDIATNKLELKSLGITHILNAAKGEKFSQIDTDQTFYNDENIKFFGCNLMDVNNCKIDEHFDKAADFIYQALDIEKGKILVHCFMGISRSASLILAYLIKHRKRKLHEAIRIVAKQRLIWPNEGFLGKLIQYQNDLNK